MTDAKMEEDPVVEAVGFKMINLKAFPFSCLPGAIQIEVIEELDMNEKMKLLNVTSGLRGYFARNGVFGRHVDKIKIRPNRINPSAGQIRYKLETFVEKGRPHARFDFLKDRALFRKICSCTRLILIWPYLYDWYERRHNPGRLLTNKQQLEEVIRADADVRSIGEWFPNLLFVEKLVVDTGKPNSLVEKMFEASRFKVTDFAAFYCDNLGFLTGRRRHWKHLLANQLSICRKVSIRTGSSLGPEPQEIPGMQIEKDAKKKNDLVDTFKKELESVGLSIKGFGRSEVNWYRKEIGEDKDMIMAVYGYST